MELYTTEAPQTARRERAAFTLGLLIMRGISLIRVSPRVNAHMANLWERVQQGLFGMYDLERELGLGGEAIACRPWNGRHEGQGALEVARQKLYDGRPETLRHPAPVGEQNSGFACRERLCDRAGVLNGATGRPGDLL